MTLEGTPSIVSQAGIAGVEFLDEVDTANHCVPELQAQGVESIVVLLHEGGVQASDPTFQNSLDDDCDNLNGPIVDIVDGFDDAVDVVVSGHTHQAYSCEGAEAIDGRLVTSAASFGRVVTDLRLTLDKRTEGRPGGPGGQRHRHPQRRRPARPAPRRPLQGGPGGVRAPPATDRIRTTP